MSCDEELCVLPCPDVLDCYDTPTPYVHRSFTKGRMKPQIIGLAGHANCGKDTIARLIGWPRIAFADELKRRFALAIGSDLPTIEKRKSELRDGLVAVGRGARLIDPDFWITFVSDKMDSSPSARWIVTDVRYVNEAEMIHRRGGVVVWIDRDGVEPANAEEAEHGPQVKSLAYVSCVRNVEPEDAVREVLFLAGVNQ